MRKIVLSVETRGAHVTVRRVADYDEGGTLPAIEHEARGGLAAAIREGKASGPGEGGTSFARAARHLPKPEREALAAYLESLEG